MCGRYRLTRADKLAGRFDIEADDDWAPRFNVAPTQDVPDSGTRHFRLDEHY